MKSRDGVFIEVSSEESADDKASMFVNLDQKVSIDAFVLDIFRIRRDISEMTIVCKKSEQTSGHFLTTYDSKEPSGLVVVNLAREEVKVGSFVKFARVVCQISLSEAEHLNRSLGVEQIRKLHVRDGCQKNRNAFRSDLESSLKYAYSRLGMIFCTYQQWRDGFLRMAVLREAEEEIIILLVLALYFDRNGMSVQERILKLGEVRFAEVVDEAEAMPSFCEDVKKYGDSFQCARILQAIAKGRKANPICEPIS